MRNFKQDGEPKISLLANNYTTKNFDEDYVKTKRIEEIDNIRSFIKKNFIDHFSLIRNHINAIDGLVKDSVYFKNYKKQVFNKSIKLMTVASRYYRREFTIPYVKQLMKREGIALYFLAPIEIDNEIYRIMNRSYEYEN